MSTHNMVQSGNSTATNVIKAAQFADEANASLTHFITPETAATSNDIDVLETKEGQDYNVIGEDADGNMILISDEDMAWLNEGGVSQEDLLDAKLTTANPLIRSLNGTVGDATSMSMLVTTQTDQQYVKNLIDNVSGGAEADIANKMTMQRALKQA